MQMTIFKIKIRKDSWYFSLKISRKTPPNATSKLIYLSTERYNSRSNRGRKRAQLQRIRRQIGSALFDNSLGQ